MNEQLILNKIRSVRRRLQVQRFFQTLAKFLFYGLLLSVPLFVIDSFTTFDVSPFVWLWLALGISAAVLITRALRPVSLYEAARTIDTVASLKDRVVSVLEFIQRQSKERLTELQIRDTFDHLQTVRADEVVRYSIPGQAKFVLLIAVVLLAFSYIEFFAPPAASTEIDHSPQITAEADHLLKQIEEVKKEAEQIGDRELTDIVNEAEKKALEMKKAQMTQKEALAKLTEMGTMLQSKMEATNMAKLDALLKGLGQQFSGNPNLAELGYALQRGEYDRAADKLLQLSEKLNQLNQEQRQNLADEFKRGGKNLQNTELDSLGTALTKAGEALSKNDVEEAKKQLLKACQSLSRCATLKRCNSLLAKLLSQSQVCKAGICKNNKPGSATAPNPFGELTNLDSIRQLQHITGIQGEGPSSVQISEIAGTSEEGQGSAVDYKQIYNKYQKLSEEALSQEQIPLGYRFYVKRYFESIRPRENE
ncbi:hypothetical protein HYR99_31020 [Candidatus Poribacteria bacterium]|nr:hypothetical protein [Candidatus Poribacteria bacterium]